MYLLAIDTATNAGGVALARNEEVLAIVMAKAPLQYSERLISQIDFLLSQFALGPSDLDCLAVASGPGSFTGIRIGLAAVKALGQGLGLPVAGVSTLEALAWRFRQIAPRVGPMIDARRQQVFGAVVDVSGREPKTVVEETVLPPAEWLRRLPREECLLVGDGAQMYASTAAALRPGDRLIRSDNMILEAVCGLGFLRFAAGDLQDAGCVKANYVRPSDAERNVRSTVET